jgi:DNA-binding GntR family transcriptional regulator
MEGKSKFEKAAEFIRDKIRSGEWPVGHKLPSQAAWNDNTTGLGWSLKYGTLRAVYITLRTEGWIDSQQGEGVYVAKNNPHAKTQAVKPHVEALSAATKPAQTRVRTKRS